MDFEKLERKICDFINSCVENARAKGVVIGLSGGLDSALVATLCQRAFASAQGSASGLQSKENAEQNTLQTDKEQADKKASTQGKSPKNAEQKGILALIMPTQSSNKANLKDALMLCESLNLEHKTIEIQPILDAFLSACESVCKTRMGNLSARIRMSLLYDYSALKGYLVVGTSNKSERMLGYGTIYGDLACAFNPIGELYKSDIFEFARYLGVPQCFIDKAPSADLYEGQSDEKELGFKYAEIDELLKALKRVDTQKIAHADKNLLEMVEKRIKTNAFKNSMPLIFKDI